MRPIAIVFIVFACVSGRGSGLLGLFLRSSLPE